MGIVFTVLVSKPRREVSIQKEKGMTLFEAFMEVTATFNTAFYIFKNILMLVFFAALILIWRAYYKL